MDKTRRDGSYEQACALLDGLLLLHDKPTRELDATGRDRLGRALTLLGKVVRADTSHWPALWLMGKICQRLGEFARSLDCFTEAHRVNPNHPDVAREASIAAMDFGQPERAVMFCERAIAANPVDAGLAANLALALLFSGRPSEAAAVADESLRRSPSDEITARIAAVIGEVRGGTRACPRHIRDIE